MLNSTNSAQWNEYGTSYTNSVKEPLTLQELKLVAKYLTELKTLKENYNQLNIKTTNLSEVIKQQDEIIIYQDDYIRSMNETLEASKPAFYDKLWIGLIIGTVTTYFLMK